MLKVGDQIQVINNDRLSFGKVGYIIKIINNPNFMYITDIKGRNGIDLPYRNVDIEKTKNQIIYEILNDL